MDHHFKERSNHKLRLRLFFAGLAVGVFSGLFVSLFRFLLQQAELHRTIFLSHIHLTNNILQLVTITGTFILLALILKYLITHEPMASGSGIPQVKGALLNLMDLNWFRVIYVKILGGVIAIGTGLSLGREGPSIQLGAMAARGLSKFFHFSRTETHYLLTSGAAAGLAAAFNAPLAGVIFALEELHHNFSMVVLLPSMAAAFCATFVSRILFGGDSVFIFPELSALPLSSVWIVIAVSVSAGILGIVFNKGLLNISKFYSLFPSLLGKLIFILLLTLIFGLTVPQVLGGGSELINHLVNSRENLNSLFLLLFLKFVFTLLSYGAGTPGGFFLPMLVIGALTGAVTGKILLIFNLIAPQYALNIIVITMVAFFAASVRSPITGTVLIMEMTKSYSILLSCSMGAMTGFVIAELLKSPPIYEALLQKILQNQKYASLLQERNLKKRDNFLQKEDRFLSE